MYIGVGDGGNPSTYTPLTPKFQIPPYLVFSFRFLAYMYICESLKD